MRFLFILALVASLLGVAQIDSQNQIPSQWQASSTEVAAYAKEYPVTNVPPSLREKNWGGGSCVHASLVMLFRWQGRYAMAAHWRNTYIGGEYANRCHSRLEKEGVRWAATHNDVKFLEWACRTRRGCAVTVMNGAHMVCLVHFDEKYAGILDNNRIDKIKWMTREAFVKEWKNSSGWAVTPVYSPPAPLPWVQ